MRCRLRPRREVLVERGKTSARLRITSPWPLLFLADVDLKVNSNAGELGVWRSFWGGDQGLLGNVFWKDSRISDTEGLDSRSGWSSMHFVVPRINSGQVATPNPTTSSTPYLALARAACAGIFLRSTMICNSSTLLVRFSGSCEVCENVSQNPFLQFLRVLSGCFMIDDLGVRNKTRDHEKGARRLRVAQACAFLGLGELADNLLQKFHQGFDALVVVAFGSGIAFRCAHQSGERRQQVVYRVEKFIFHCVNHLSSVSASTCLRLLSSSGVCPNSRFCRLGRCLASRDGTMFCRIVRICAGSLLCPCKVTLLIRTGNVVAPEQSAGYHKGGIHCRPAMTCCTQLAN